MIENISQRKVAESALVAQSQLNEYQAVHDALTDVPNRTLFRQRIQHAVARSEEDGEFAVVIMDLDRFKEVNDSMGHHAGDALLIEVARRVESALRTSDMVARLGGDEFGLLLATPTGATGLATVLERVRASSTTSRSRSRPRWALPLTPTTAVTSRRCCEAPTSPCTPPSAPTCPSRSTTRRCASSPKASRARPCGRSCAGSAARRRRGTT